jgi:hypothetical protein
VTDLGSLPVEDRLTAALRAAEEDLLLAPAAQALTADSGTAGFGFENIVGVGAPTPMSGIDGSTVAIYVVRKAPPERLDEALTIPTNYEGVPTEVVETGEFVTLTQRGRYRPAPIGVSVGHIEGETGTLGFFARSASGLVLVSNNHVLARTNMASAGDPILQPGSADHGGPEDAIGELDHFVQLDFEGGKNPADAASARVDEGVALEKLSEGGELVANPASARPNIGVFKCGRTTGVTHGLVSDIAATIKVRYGLGTALLSDQILVRGVQSPFSAPGDSGSLVIDSSSRCPVGMVCGGSTKFTVVNKIENVLTGLGLSF